MLADYIRLKRAPPYLEQLGQIIHDLREDLVCGDFSFMQTVKGMALAPGRTCQEYVQGK